MSFETIAQETVDDIHADQDQTENTENTQAEKIDIQDGISPEEAEKMNQAFSNKPKQTINNLKQIIKSDEKKIDKKELTQSILTGINNCDSHFDTQENINNFLTLLDNLKSLDPTIDNTIEGENPYNILKQTLEDKKTALEQNKQKEANETAIITKIETLINAKPSAEIAAQFFDLPDQRIYSNALLQYILDDKPQGEQINNIQEIFTLYIGDNQIKENITIDNLKKRIKT